MKTLRLVNVVLGLFLMSSASGMVFAACNNVDLRGVWQAYEDLDGMFTDCSYELDRDGNLSGADCNVYDELGNPIWTNILAEGQYVVDGDCSVTGQIQLFAVTFTIQRAKINNSRDVIRGAHRNDFTNTTTIFTMFRVD